MMSIISNLTKVFQENYYYFNDKGTKLCKIMQNHTCSESMPQIGQTLNSRNELNATSSWMQS